ncbi:MAG: hypothetical protein WBW26_01700, partial [Bradyrhizobium sp.]|uniref:hypothetical protein n=1 Tax=Bradyrhizobium sp. TaxID=376 RepID=UPI003C5D1FCC
GGPSVRQQEKCMHKFAIRLLTLAMFAMASAAVYMVAPAKAATENGTTVKKKHKKARVNSESGQMRAPATSSQYPSNMSDDPNRKISY